MDETGTVVQPLIKVKSVTLTRGHWIYVCPCGFQYSVSWVPKTTSKHALYCFRCKGQNGRYYKVMDERLEFTENWNGKLFVGPYLAQCRTQPYRAPVFSVV